MKRQGLNVLYRQDSRQPASMFSREHAITRGGCAETIAIYGDKQHWMAFKDYYALTCVGPRVFWKKGRTDQATFKNGKFYGSIEPFKETLLQVFNLDWILTNKWALRLLGNKKDLWRGVFDNKITNPEMLCKAISKKYFKGAYSYRTLREMATNHPNIASLWDLFYYTTNPEENLKAALKEGWLPSLWNDSLQYAKILNEKIDFRWSERRLNEVHQSQIERLNASKAEEYSDECIAEPFRVGKLSLILNERECFMEGNQMHNCVHSCYWKKITAGNYLLAHGAIGDEYVDYGITVNWHEGELFTDQIHTIRNGYASREAIDYCCNWLQDNKNELLTIADEIRRKRLNDRYILPEPPQEIDIPF